MCLSLVCFDFRIAEQGNIGMQLQRVLPVWSEVAVWHFPEEQGLLGIHAAGAVAMFP